MNLKSQFIYALLTIFTLSSSGLLAEETVPTIVGTYAGSATTPEGYRFFARLTIFSSQIWVPSATSESGVVSVPTLAARLLLEQGSIVELPFDFDEGSFNPQSSQLFLSSHYPDSHVQVRWILNAQVDGLRISGTLQTLKAITFDLKKIP